MHSQSETLGARMALAWIPLFLMAFSGRIQSKNNMFLVEVKNDGGEEDGPDTGAGSVDPEEAGTDYADSEEHGHGYGASKYGAVEPSYARPVEPKYVPVEPKYVPVETKYESAETVETYEPPKPKYEVETSYKHERCVCV